MFRYRLHTALGEEIGEATHRFLIEPGEELTLADNQRFRVIDVIPIETQGSEVVALMYVETAKPRGATRHNRHSSTSIALRSPKQTLEL